MKMISAELDNLTRWQNKKRDFFETYYIKWNDCQQNYAGWVRYTLYSSTSHQPEAAVWGTFIDFKDPSKRISIKETFPLEKAEISRDCFRLIIGSSGITHREAWGEVSANNVRLSWKLRAEDEGLMVRHIPWPLYRGSLPPTKFVAPLCWYPLSGEVIVNEQALSIKGSPAHQGHFWGTKQVSAWTWGNCSSFQDDPTFKFEGVVGMMRHGNVELPPVRSFFFHWEDKLYACNDVITAFFINQSQHDLCKWEFQAKSGNLLFVGEMKSSPEDMIVYRFQDPDGELRYSHNNFKADLKIEIYRLNGSDRQKIKTVTAEGTAAFEVAQPQLDSRVKWQVYEKP